MTPFADLANAIQSSETPVTLWWRDDDAHRQHTQLDRLLALSARFSVPVALAVVPDWYQASLADSLAPHQGRVRCLVHGFAHANHAPATERKCEYPVTRSVDSVRQELLDGVAILQSALPQHFAPVFVPPWNRMATEHYPALTAASLIALSARFNNEAAPGLLNLPVHLDIVNWEATSFRGEADCLEVLIKAIKTYPGAPIGIMTHHLVHDDACWAFLESLFDHLRSMSNCRVVSIDSLLDA